MAEREGASIAPQRLRFITNLVALRGLDVVVVGAMFFLVSVDSVWNSPWWLFPFFFAVGLLMAREIPTKYYERRFGRVEPKLKRPTTRREAIGCLITILLLAALLIWGRRLEVWVDANLIGDPSGQVRLLALLFWTMWISNSLGRDSGSDPRGPLFYIIGLGVSAAVSFYPKWYPGVTQSMLWRTLNAGSAGLSLMASGLRDYFQLLHFLPKNGSDDEEEDES